MPSCISEGPERYYRCYLVKDEHIVGHEVVFGRDDDAAIEKAREILEASTFLTIEVWRGAERIASIGKSADLFADRGSPLRTGTDVRT
jgi:hypothetical protein